MIPYGKQDITQEDINEVLEVLNSDFLTQGPKVPEFELAISNYVQCKYALATNSATSALHIACLALGVSKGDWVWTSVNSFVASSNCALYCGAYVDFIDIDPQTGNICLTTLEAMLCKAKHENKLPKVIIPVHFAGQSCNMPQIFELAQRFGVAIIEDASHAIGGEYHSGKIGNCQYSDITVFSFHPVKIITTAEGGIAVTNKKELANKMALFRSHGITKDPNSMVNNPEGSWYYEQQVLGFNYRMTELQASLGISQLKRIDEYIKLRNCKAQYYDNALKLLPLTPLDVVHGKSAYHLYVIKLNDSSLHSKVFTALKEAQVGVNLHYIPISTQPYYQKLGYNFTAHPNALDYYSRAISIPLFPTMSKNEQDYVINVLSKILT